MITLQTVSTMLSLTQSQPCSNRVRREFGYDQLNVANDRIPDTPEPQDRRCGAPNIGHRGRLSRGTTASKGWCACLGNRVGGTASLLRVTRHAGLWSACVSDQEKCCM